MRAAGDGPSPRPGPYSIDIDANASATERLLHMLERRQDEVAELVTRGVCSEVNTTLAEAYVIQSQQLAADADRLKRDLLEDLLSGRLGLRDEASTRAAGLGLSPTGEYCVALATLWRGAEAGEPGAAPPGV